jgi:hypothetical protein
MELIQGCQNLSEQQTLMKTLSAYQSAWPSETSCNQALATFQIYHLSHSLGIIDALIAQTTIERGLPLHTFNQKHYAMIPGLQTIQPYKRL